MKIKIVNGKAPVVLKINNVVPLRAKVEFPQPSNKSHLQYISNNFTITFLLPEGSCLGQYDKISQYKQWNSEIKSDYEALLNFVEVNYSTLNEKDKARKKLQILGKYETARKGIKETDCDELRQEYATFRYYYNKIGEGLVTADSLQRMIDQMYQLIDDISIASNRGDRNCNALKAKVSKYNAVKIDESIYDDIPELRTLIKRFQECRTHLNGIRCPMPSGGGGNGDGF